MSMDMLAAPKKIVDGLTEVFQGFAQMFEGVSEQLELLAASAPEEDKLLPVSTVLSSDKPLPADVSAKGVTVPRPRKKPVKRHKAPDAGPVADSETVEETAPDPAEEDAQDDTAAEDTEDNSLPADTTDTPPWEDTQAADYRRCVQVRYRQSGSNGVQCSQGCRNVIHRCHYRKRRKLRVV